MELDKKVQHLNELHDFTQGKLAKLIGVTQASISRIESGIVADPNVKGIMKLAISLGVPVEDLLDNSISIENWQDEIKSFQISNDGKELLKVYLELKQKQKRLLFDFAQLLKHQDSFEDTSPQGEKSAKGTKR